MDPAGRARGAERHLLEFGRRRDGFITYRGGFLAHREGRYSRGMALSSAWRESRESKSTSDALCTKIRTRKRRTKIDIRRFLARPPPNLPKTLGRSQNARPVARGGVGTHAGQAWRRLSTLGRPK